MKPSPEIKRKICVLIGPRKILYILQASKTSLTSGVPDKKTNLQSLAFIKAVSKTLPLLLPLVMLLIRLCTSSIITTLLSKGNSSIFLANPGSSKCLNEYLFFIIELI